MAKKQDDLKAKQKRQKKIAIVGGVILVALLAIQAPKTMKKLHQKPPPLPGQVLPPNGNPAGVTTPSLAAPTLGTETTASGAAGTAAGAGAEAGAASALAVYEIAPQPQTGQLPDLGRFVSKDPFVQQGQGAGASGSDGSGSDSGSGSGSGDGGATTPTPTPVPTTPSTPSLPASSARISINGGDPATVAVGTDFPADNPLFHLVSATTTTARVGIAGGSYADGRNTVTLKVGKPVTLQNTADGTRYTLVLQPPA